MIICSQCGTTVGDDEQFCTECGARVPAINAYQIPTIAAAAPPVRPQSGLPTYAPGPLAGEAIPPKKPTNPIVWVAIPFGLLVIVIITVIGISVSSSNKNSNTSPNTSSTTNSSTTTTTPTSPGLPNSFQRDYQGTIGSNNTLEFSATLIRSGRDLRGTASTGRKTDMLSGTIETDGRFRLEGRENGQTWSGIYTGQIYTDGTITGSWVTTTGEKETPFFLRQQ